MNREGENWLVSLAKSGVQAQGWMVGVAAVVLLLTMWGLAEWLMGGHLEDLGQLGYLGVFLITLLASGSIILPVPGLLSVLAAGTVWNPALVGLAAGLGGATGELTGYAVGVTGAAVLGERTAKLRLPMLQSWFGRYAFVVILVMAAVPNPAFDAVGIFAGVLRYPIWRFWLACFLGNSTKYLAAAYIGDAARWMLS